MKLNRSGVPTTKQEVRLSPTQKDNLIKYCERYSEAPLAIIKLNGKTPFSRNWQNAKPLTPKEAKTIATIWLETPDYPNFGVALPHDILAIDVDPRGFKKGREANTCILWAFPQLHILHFCGSFSGVSSKTHSVWPS